MSLSLIDILEQIAPLPTGAARALAGFDVSGELERIKDIADKDRRRIEGFIPAVIKRATELSMQVGFRLGNADGSVDVLLEQASEEASQFIAETSAIVRMWERQFKGFMGGDIMGDPTKAEREITRIWAKRNALDPTYLDILGVSEGTPSEYPEDFKEQWL